MNTFERVKRMDSIEFYGIDGYRFKLGDHVFEAVEDPDDGYRSMMRRIKLCRNSGIFFPDPLDIVSIVEVCNSNFDGYELRSIKDGHIWLQFGTETEDFWYPCFRFYYTPREEEIQ